MMVRNILEYTFFIHIKSFLEPLGVEFIETVHTVQEDSGTVIICVNLTQPEYDIRYESVVVNVIDFSNSSAIFPGSVLASKSMLY